MKSGNDKIKPPSDQIGKISGIEDCGTIVIVRLRTAEGWNTPVFFDHRQFRYMLDAEGCGAEELVGRAAINCGNGFVLVA